MFIVVKSFFSEILSKFNIKTVAPLKPTTINKEQRFVKLEIKYKIIINLNPPWPVDHVIKQNNTNYNLLGNYL